MATGFDARIGYGVDAHPVERGRPCRIGGIEIPAEAGPVGHSDGDPLLHALTDALLGACGDGDLGQHFPDSDPRWRGADSATFVQEAVRRLRAAGLAVVNADTVVFADRPRVAPHRDAIRRRVATLLGIAPERVNVKAKTLQGFAGAPGVPIGIAAHAVVLCGPAPA